MTTPATTIGSNISPMVRALEGLLASNYTLYLTAQHHHWNVEGDQFTSLHALFETQYRDAFDALDEIAERIRMLDYYVQPVQADPSVALGVTEGDSGARAETMIQQLISQHQSVIAAAKAVIDATGAESDPVSEDLAIGRIATHEKHIWMLKSLLK